LAPCASWNSERTILYHTAVRTRLAAFLAALVTAVPLHGRQAPDLATVLARVAVYIEAYTEKLAGIVAEEHYTQYVRRTGPPLRTDPRVVTHRELKSDVLLVRPAGDGPWLQFRDVFEVDRKPVRDRDERLLKLFVEPKGDRSEQAMTISLEGARYNIGPVTRTINVPVLALAFLSRENQPRSRFARASTGNLRRFDGLAAPGEIVALTFVETATLGAMVRGVNDKDLPSQGKVWVDRSSGRVLATEHVVRDDRVWAKIAVTYGRQEGLPVLVPTTMQEQYNYRQPDTYIAGTATYGRFRQFTVMTQEQLKKPPG
jgi:hypothetical protein